MVIGMQGGTRAELDLGVLLRKRARSRDLAAGPPCREKAAIVAAVREHVWPLIEAGEVRPVVMSRHPLADAAAAHRELEASAHIGKILLSRELASQTKVLAANQGLYNGFLVAGLLLAMVGPSEHRFAFAVFSLGCVIVAGLYGAATASRKILFVQTVPAALALAAQFLAR
jgi:uncharacterized membrane protein